MADAEKIRRALKEYAEVREWDRRAMELLPKCSSLAEAYDLAYRYGAKDSCAKCGHDRDGHGDWYDCPEDGCGWNDADGRCSCRSFEEAYSRSYQQIENEKESRR